VSQIVEGHVSMAWMPDTLYRALYSSAAAAFQSTAGTFYNGHCGARISALCCADLQDPLFGSVQPLFARQIFNPTALAYCPQPIILEGAGGRVFGY
jgi:hypothetical protein